MKLFAEWFWIERWEGSSAAMLPMEAQGIYRAMLSHAWRRGASLPVDPEEIQLLIRCRQREWKRSWPAVRPYWHEENGVLVNDTQREVYAEAKVKKERAQARAQAGAKARHKQVLKVCPPSPSPTKQTTEVPPARASEPPPPEPADAECQTASDELVKALHRAKEVTGLDGADILAHSTVRGKGAVIVNPSVCSPAALKLWRIAAERVYGFVAAWEADQREAQGKRGKAKGKAPAWDRGDMGAADLTAQAVEWVRARWPVGAPSSRAELEARLAALDPPAELRGEILTHLLFGRYPSLATAGATPAETGPAQKAPTLSVTVAPGRCPMCDGPITHTTDGGAKVLRCLDDQGLRCDWAAVWREVAA